jgi:hypothetical protein
VGRKSGILKSMSIELGSLTRITSTAFWTSGCGYSDLLQSYGRAGAKVITEPLDKYGKWRCYIRDPDGTLLRLEQAGVLYVEAVYLPPPVFCAKSR